MGTHISENAQYSFVFLWKRERSQWIIPKNATVKSVKSDINIPPHSNDVVGVSHSYVTSGSKVGPATPLPFSLNKFVSRFDRRIRSYSTCRYMFMYFGCTCQGISGNEGFVQSKRSPPCFKCISLLLSGTSFPRKYFTASIWDPLCTVAFLALKCQTDFLNDKSAWSERNICWLYWALSICDTGNLLKLSYSCCV